MDFELAESAFPATTDPVLPRRRKIDKDEAVLALFGKSQQLRVSIVI